VGFKIAEDATLWMGIASFAFLPFWIGMFFFSNSKVVVDGANDNLTGCYIPIALMKGLKELGIELENTEVGVILSGSEEAGLRGAKAWAAAHKGEYKDVPTFIVSYDTIHELDCLNINDKDLNGLVTVDKDVCELLMEASDNVGAGATYATVTVGATDPAAFVQGGFKSACITALDHSLKPYYHTRKDTYDLLDKECLGVVYDMSVEALKIFDSGKYDNVGTEVVKAKSVRKDYKAKKKA
jgi:Zn-dependent M28 family amino/carboxypeptidase